MRFEPKQQVPYLDLAELHAPICGELVAAAASVIESGSYVLGPEVEAFESEYAKWCGGGSSVAVNSGTSALVLALRALDIGPGDEVITTPLTFMATAAAVEYVGARVVFADVDSATWTLSPEAAESAISDRTAAIMPVHLHGRVADMSGIMRVARSHSLAVIEDAAQAHGAVHSTMGPVGLIGDVAAFSFFPGKNLGALGEGGAVLSQDMEVLERVRVLRDWGSPTKYVHDELGYNFRMDAIQAAMLRVKLRHLSDWTNARIRIGREYGDAFSALTPFLPVTESARDHVFHVYALRVAERNALQDALGEAGIASSIHYPIPLHMQRAFSHLGYEKGDFPEAERLAREFLSLPICPTLCESQRGHVIESVTCLAKFAI